MIQRYKYPAMVCLFFLAAAGCVMLFINGLKKDHSLDAHKLEQRLQDEKRQEVQKLRSVYLNQVQQLQQQITTLQIKDSLLALQGAVYETKIKTISTPQYVYEQIAPVYNYNDAELLDFYNNLPDTRQPNDY